MLVGIDSLCECCDGCNVSVRFQTSVNETDASMEVQKGNSVMRHAKVRHADGSLVC